MECLNVCKVCALLLTMTGCGDDRIQLGFRVRLKGVSLFFKSAGGISSLSVPCFGVVVALNKFELYFLYYFLIVKH